MRAVVLDLETSGLSSKEDSIIEVAALKFDTDTGEIEEWTSLINPGFVIQEEITFLTSITPEQLVSAPYFEEVLGTLQRFVGDLPIIGHNVSFDVDFLVENGFDLGFRPIIDTFHLANFLYSDLKSLNLSNIVEDLGYIHADAHRAMSDVRATKFLFDAELEKMRHFSQEEYHIFASVSARTQNSPLDYIHGLIAPGYQVMELSAELGMKQFFSSPLEKLKMSQMVPDGDKKLFFDDINSKEKIETVLDKIHLETIAEKNNLEKRPEQFRMSGLILEAFQTSKHICIEAPTGVGKTFSYLVPAIRTALATGKTVCVSTNTKTLQDQICLRDIPKVLSLLEKEGIKSIRFQKLKGRNNYLSWLKFFEFFEQAHFTPEESYFALKIAFWSLKTESGELDELMMYGVEFQLMQEVSASDLRVTSPENIWKEYEFLLIARTRLNTAHIAVLNHALLLSEYLEDSQIGILPKLEHLVLDEVHNLESVASDTLRATCSAEDIGKTVQDIEKIIRKYNRENPTVPFLDPLITSSTQGLLLAAGDFYGLCTNCISTKRESTGGYGKGKTTDMLIESDTLSPLRADMILAKSAIFERIHELEAAAFGAPEKLAGQLGRYVDFLYGYHDHIALFVSEEQKNTIRILTKREHTEVQTVTIPLSVGDILQEKLWNKVPSIVMTSATLCIHNSFDYIQKVLHITDFEFHILATDFDYSKQSLLYIPTGFGDIRKNEQKHAIENFLKELLGIYKGRTLMLFTSFASIKEMAVSLAKHMKGLGVDILPQGLGGGKHRLALAFTKNAHKSILLGTDSFWEGVDFPGNLLELLVIYKLPFSVPTDPVIVARSRLYKDSFQEYALPMMILKLRQGIGRLIRTKNDKGVIVVMDSRITAPWGNTILESLPAGMPVRQASPEVFLSKLREKQADVNMNSR